MFGEMVQHFLDREAVLPWVEIRCLAPQQAKHGLGRPGATVPGPLRQELLADREEGQCAQKGGPSRVACAAGSDKVVERVSPAAGTRHDMLDGSCARRRPVLLHWAGTVRAPPVLSLGEPGSSPPFSSRHVIPLSGEDRPHLRQKRTYISRGPSVGPRDQSDPHLPKSQLGRRFASLKSDQSHVLVAPRPNH